MKDPIKFPLQFDKSEDSKELFGMELHGIIDTQVTLAVRLKFCKNYFNCGFQHMGRDSFQPTDLMKLEAYSLTFIALCSSTLRTAKL